MIKEEIKKLREELNLTQEEFAKILGTHTSTVYRWESGASQPEKNHLLYLHAMQDILARNKKEALKKALTKALIIGGTLAAVYALLKLFFEADDKKNIS
jgi:DNA-binding transcriptional regulator YiaG